MAAQVPAIIDDDWMSKELIPFLVAVYGEPYADHWQSEVRIAAESVSSLPIYEDFESTIERFRLLLINPHILTDAEMKDFGSLRDDKDLCVAVFVRHFVNHGPYELHSLGCDPSPDHPREKITVQNRKSYIYGGKMSRNSTKGSASKVGKSQTTAAPRTMSKGEASQSNKKQRRHAPVEPRPQSRISSAQPFANPACGGSGVPYQVQQHVPTQGVARPVKEPMHMHGPPRGYQQWNTSHAVMQPYSSSSHYSDPHNRPTLPQGNKLYETSHEYEHAHPVGSSIDSVAPPYLHQGQNTSSTTLSPTKKSSLPRPQVGTKVANPTFQPSRGAQQLRMTASDFVPGVSEHDF